MEVLKHGNKYKGGTLTCTCGCKFKYENDDIEIFSEGWSMYTSTIKKTFKVTCPECGEQWTIGKVGWHNGINI